MISPASIINTLHPMTGVSFSGNTHHVLVTKAAKPMGINVDLELLCERPRSNKDGTLTVEFVNDRLDVELSNFF